MQVGTAIVRAIVAEVYEHIDKDEIAILADDLGIAHLIFNDEDTDATMDVPGFLKDGRMAWEKPQPIDYHGLVGVVDAIITCSPMALLEYEGDSEHLNVVVDSIVSRWNARERYDELEDRLGETYAKLSEAEVERDEAKKELAEAKKARTSALLRMRLLISQVQGNLEEADDYLKKEGAKD